MRRNVGSMSPKSSDKELKEHPFEFIELTLNYSNFCCGTELTVIIKPQRPMCYHTALIDTPQELAQRFNRKADLIREFRPSYHVSAFSHAEYLIVTADRQLQFYRWGLIPFWTHDLEDALTYRNRTINARAETIFTKPSYRKPIRERRCLVPASGFFDWRHEGKQKIPYYITLKHEPILAFAGIYDVWHNEVTNEKVYTYSIITTRANKLMSEIHNTNFRMPVILHRELEAQWLVPDLTEAQISELLRSYPSREMTGEAIQKDFLHKAPDDPTIPTLQMTATS